MTVHPSAAEGFRTADLYERGRASYPSEAIMHLCSALDR